MGSCLPRPPPPAELSLSDLQLCVEFGAGKGLAPREHVNVICFSLKNAPLTKIYISKEKIAIDNGKQLSWENGLKLELKNCQEMAFLFFPNSALLKSGNYLVHI